MVRKMKKTAYLIANFGGPRSLEEVRPFLEELLTDKDVVRTRLPQLFHNILFKRIAKKRSLKVAEDYESIGGKSPIFGDTEVVAAKLREKLEGPLLTFHRYLPATHQEFISQIERLDCDEIRIFPMFPQFTYATTGSIARWFSKNLKPSTINKMRWIKSYPSHPAFVRAHQESIRRFLNDNGLKEDDTLLLFSAHGVPQKFVDQGDLYEDECRLSYRSVMEAFPRAKGHLAYQSKFGPGEWLKPYTSDVCEDILSLTEGRPHVVFIPISFTSDHIETLFEIEQDYMTVVREKGASAYRVPALTLDPLWIDAIHTILQEVTPCNNQMLIR